MYGKSSLVIIQGRDEPVDGGVCLFHPSRYVSRPLAMPRYRSVKVLAVRVQGSGANIVIVVVNRLSSTPADKLFFDEFADLMERDAALFARS